MNATTTADAVREIADDILAQIIDHDATEYRHLSTTIAGDYVEVFRRYFATFAGRDGIPGGVATVTVDVSPHYWTPRGHEVRVYFHAAVEIDSVTRQAAAAIEAAALDQVEEIADARRIR